MGKKKFNIGDTVLFYHTDFEHKVKGTVKELLPNNLIYIIFIHPIHGYQLWGVHTSALQIVEEVCK